MLPSWSPAPSSSCFLPLTLRLQLSKSFLPAESPLRSLSLLRSFSFLRSLSFLCPSCYRAPYHTSKNITSLPRLSISPYTYMCCRGFSLSPALARSRVQLASSSGPTGFSVTPSRLFLLPIPQKKNLRPGMMWIFVYYYIYFVPLVFCDHSLALI